MRTQATLSLWLAIALAGCSHRTAPEGSSRDNREPLQLLLDVKGNVTIRRAGWSVDVPALFGIALHPGDALYLDGLASARIVCADLSAHPLRPGMTNAVDCPTLNVISGNGAPAEPLRSATGLAVILPRQGMVLNTRPNLRWEASDAVVGGYTLVMHTPSTDTKEVFVKADGKEFQEIPYPQSWPSVRADGPYRLRVKTVSDDSDRDTNPGLQFSLITSVKKTDLDQELLKISAQSLGGSSQTFLRAHLYRSKGLYSDAIETLEHLRTDNLEPAVPRALGDIYFEMGLSELARQSYGEALRLSGERDDIEGQAWLHRRLGEIQQKAFSNNENARQQYQQALKLYQRLGDQKAESYVQDRISEVSL
jgi:hypothetical protein